MHGSMYHIQKRYLCLIIMFYHVLSDTIDSVISKCLSSGNPKIRHPKTRNSRPYLKHSDAILNPVCSKFNVD